MKRIPIAIVAFVMALLASLCFASPIDMHRASSGADRPFTVLKDNLPTEWRLFLYHDLTLTESTVDREWQFPERALNNMIFANDMSHVLQLGSRRRLVQGQRTGIYIIYDMLAWQLVPHLLYLDEIEATGIPVEFRDPRDALRPVIAGFPDIEPIPEPATGLLLIMGCLFIASRARRQRQRC